MFTLWFLAAFAEDPETAASFVELYGSGELPSAAAVAPPPGPADRSDVRCAAYVVLEGGAPERADVRGCDGPFADAARDWLLTWTWPEGTADTQRVDVVWTYGPGTLARLPEDGRLVAWVGTPPTRVLGEYGLRAGKAQLLARGPAKPPTMPDPGMQPTDARCVATFGMRRGAPRNIKVTGCKSTSTTRGAVTSAVKEGTLDLPHELTLDFSWQATPAWAHVEPTLSSSERMVHPGGAASCHVEVVVGPDGKLVQAMGWDCPEAHGGAVSQAMLARTWLPQTNERGQEVHATFWTRVDFHEHALSDRLDEELLSQWSLAEGGDGCHLDLTVAASGDVTSRTSNDLPYCVAQPSPAEPLKKRVLKRFDGPGMCEVAVLATADGPQVKTGFGCHLKVAPVVDQLLRGWEWNRPPDGEAQYHVRLTVDPA